MMTYVETMPRLWDQHLQRVLTSTTGELNGYATGVHANTPKPAKPTDRGDSPTEKPEMQLTAGTDLARRIKEQQVFYKLLELVSVNLVQRLGIELRTFFAPLHIARELCTLNSY